MKGRFYIGMILLLFFTCEVRAQRTAMQSARAKVAMWYHQLDSLEEAYAKESYKTSKDEIANEISIVYDSLLVHELSLRKLQLDETHASTSEIATVARACYSLGDMTEAVRLFELAAQRGDLQSKNLLGVICYNLKLYDQAKTVWLEVYRDNRFVPYWPVVQNLGQLYCVLSKQYEGDSKKEMLELAEFFCDMYIQGVEVFYGEIKNSVPPGYWLSEFVSDKVLNIEKEEADTRAAFGPSAVKEFDKHFPRGYSLAEYLGTMDGYFYNNGGDLVSGRHLKRRIEDLKRKK